MKKQDLKNRQGIEVLVNRFYEKVKEDETIGFMFGHVNWDAHLPLMYDFWDNVLFHTGNYAGNPMAKHYTSHQIKPMSGNHFTRWLELFDNAVDELYVGQNADILKERAQSIATIMKLKILGTERTSLL